MIANWHHKYQPSTENSKHHYYETFKKQAIELLIDAGAEINITIDLDDSHDYYHCLPYKLQDDKWVPLNPSTPLLLAVGYGEKEIVKLLLDHGANPYATSNGKTALDIANTNAIVDNPAIHEPAREIATLLVDAQKR
jgi:ankyrin repeat protein